MLLFVVVCCDLSCDDVLLRIPVVCFVVCCILLELIVCFFYGLLYFVAVCRVLLMGCFRLLFMVCCGLSLVLVFAASLFGHTARLNIFLYFTLRLCSFLPYNVLILCSLDDFAELNIEQGITCARSPT